MAQKNTRRLLGKLSVFVSRTCSHTNAFAIHTRQLIHVTELSCTQREIKCFDFDLLAQNHHNNQTTNKSLLLTSDPELPPEQINK